MKRFHINSGSFPAARLQSIRLQWVVAKKRLRLNQYFSYTCTARICYKEILVSKQHFSANNIMQNMNLSTTIHSDVYDGLSRNIRNLYFYLHLIFYTINVVLNWDEKRKIQMSERWWHSFYVIGLWPTWGLFLSSSPYTAPINFTSRLHQHFPSKPSYLITNAYLFHNLTCCDINAYGVKNH